MAFDFPSQEWLDELMKELNNSQAYQEAAKNWEGDFYFIFEPEGGLKKRVVAYMDLWHGQCRATYIVKDEKEKNPEFIIRAPYGKWRKIIEKKLNPIQGMMTGQIKVKGNMTKIVKSPKATIGLVNGCTLVPTRFLE